MVGKVREGRHGRGVACASCATLPVMDVPLGSLLVTSRTVEHRLLIAEILEGVGLAPLHGHDGRILCAVPAGELAEVAAALGDRLAPDVLDASRATIAVAGHHDAEIADPPTLRALLRGVERAWLTDILGQHRLDTHLQPIVDVSSGQVAPFAHECLTRGRTADGATIPPGRLFAAAERAALLFHLDRSARLASVANAARHDAAGRYFVNFTPTAVYNPAYCLRSTVAAVEEGGIDPSQVTFEVIESVETGDIAHLDKIFGVYRKRGFTVALDDITGGPRSATMIGSLRPNYVKIDRSLVSLVEERETQQHEVASILEQCRGLGIEVVAEGIERPEERDWLAAAGVRLMQGYLFGRPFAA